MNVLILATHLNPGGLSRYVLNLALGLSERQHNVYIGCSGGEWVERLKQYNVCYKKLPINTKSILSIKILFSLLILSRFCYREKIEVIHANTRVVQFLGLLIWRFFKIPYVSTFHGFYNHRRLRQFVKLSGVKTIAISNAVKRYLINDLKFNAGNIRIVYNGLDFQAFTSVKNIREKYGLKKEDFLIGMLGRISEEKGQFLALEALREILEKNENIYFLISGKGKQELMLRARVEKFKLTKKVIFLESEPGEFLNVINLLLVPSRKEGFGYSIVEAFFKKVPVIGYNTGGIAEIIKDNQNGFLFYNYNYKELATRIKEVMSSEDIRKKVVQQAKEDVLFFSYARMAEATEKVYKQAIEFAQRNLK